MEDINNIEKVTEPVCEIVEASKSNGTGIGVLIGAGIVIGVGALIKIGKKGYDYIKAKKKAKDEINVEFEPIDEYDK